MGAHLPDLRTSKKRLAAHTPGPWKAAPYGDGWHITAATGPYTRIATAHAMRGDDAKLIAASPALLALAHQYADECGDCAGTRITPDGNGGDEHCTMCDDIWAVIDLAEGRS